MLKTAIPFRTLPKLDAQRISNGLLKYLFITEVNLTVFSKNMKNKLVKRFGYSPQEKLNYGTTYLNSLILKPKLTLSEAFLMPDT